MTPEIALLSPRAAVRRRAARRSRSVNALLNALHHDGDATVRARAALRLARLEVDPSALEPAALDDAPSVRAAVSMALGRRAGGFAALERSVRLEPIWWARRRSVQALARGFGARAVPILEHALSDPFWRVRHAAVRALRALGDEVVRELCARPAASEAQRAAQEYLRRQLHPRGASQLVPESTPFQIDGPLYDDDPAVMSARLEDPSFEVPDTTLALLLADPHEPLRRRALSRLLEKPSEAALRLALVWLEDPRVPHASETAARLLDRAGEPSRALAMSVLVDEGAHPRARRWASSYAHRTKDRALRALAEEPPEVHLVPLRPDPARRARDEARASSGDLDALEGSEDPALRARAAETATDPRVALRLLRDREPWVRARALTRLTDEDTADYLDDDDPRVRAAAWSRVVPEAAVIDDALGRERAPEVRAVLEGLAALHEGATVAREPRDARVSRAATARAPLILSGAHEVPEAALARAARRGVDTFFWEPRYLTMTRFLRRHPRLGVVAGSYEASRRGIERDIARARRLLGREQLDVFLLFWARSDTRLDDEAFSVLDAAKARGHIGAHGFSTHLRALACRALRRDPWDVVMTRHSAAHTGAEDELFPLARERRTRILAFSATSYGRLLGELSAPTCYRYCLDAGADAVVSAPRYARELDENLSLLRREPLSASERERARSVGGRVYRESKDLAALVRRTPTAYPVRRLREEVLGS